MFCFVLFLINCLQTSESLDKLNAVSCNNSHNLNASSGIPSILYIWLANDSCCIKLHFCFPGLPLQIFLTLQFIKPMEMEHVTKLFCSIILKSIPANQCNPLHLEEGCFTSAPFLITGWRLPYRNPFLTIHA